MEKFSYNSYADSTDSSPRSREIDFDNNQPPWDDHPNHNHQSYKVKFMCSYNGKIQPRPHDNQLTYVNGETKILSVDRGIRFPVLASKLSSLCISDGGGGGDVLFKYQLPGEDLDALISVTNEDDLEHMMHEYDRLLRTSSKPARMRLFLFPSVSSPGGFGSEGSDRDRFVEALNSTVRSSSRTESEKSVTAPTSEADFLFGSEKAAAAAQPPQVPVAIQPEFQRMQEQQQQEGVYRRKSEDTTGGYFSPTYAAAQNLAPPPPPQQPVISQTNQQAPPVTFWQGSHNNSPGGVFPATAPGLGLPEQQPVYMVPSPSPTLHPGSVYHAPQPQTQGLMRPVVTGQVNQGGYYPYNVAQPPVGVAKGQPQQEQPPPPFTSGPLPPQQQYSAVLPPQQVVGIADTRAYTQVTYAGGMGKQVYYTEAPPPPQYHGVGLPVTGGGMSELRTGPDGKLVAMNMMAPKVSSQNSDSAV